MTEKKTAPASELMDLDCPTTPLAREKCTGAPVNAFRFLYREIELLAL